MAFTVLHSKGEQEYRHADIAVAEEARRIAMNYWFENRPDVRVKCPDGRTLSYEEFARALREGEFAHA